MQRLIILIACFILLSVQPTYAQPYQSIFGIGDSASTSWVFKYGVLPGPVVDSAYIEKDTIVNGITYKKLVTDNPNNGYKGGLLREDVNAGKVWYRAIHYTMSQYDTVEQVIFRFDLNVGDTFDISNSYLQGSYPASWNVVDSIRYINGLKYIYFKGIYQPLQGGYNEPFTIIEGIGSNMGILWKHLYGGSFMADKYLLCSYKNGQKTSFQNKFYKGACTIKTGDIYGINDKSNTITFFPIPAADKITIKNKTTEKINKVQIISHTGQLVKEVTSLEITSVEIEDIPAGYYYLKLYTGNGYITVKPMVVR